MHNNNVSHMIHGLQPFVRHVNHDELKFPLVDQQQFVYCTTIIAIIIESRTGNLLIVDFQSSYARSSFEQFNERN